MRVALLHFTAPPVLGGVESVIYEQARILVANGHEVTLVAGRGGRAGGLDVNFVRIPLMTATNVRQKRIALELALGNVPEAFHVVANRLTHELDEVLEGMDAIIVHNAFTLHFNQPLTAALAALASGPFSGRVVAWTHDVAAVNALYIPEMHPGYPWELLRSAQPGVRYVCISYQRRDELIKLWDEQAAAVEPPGGGKSERTPVPEVIPNGIDLSTSLRLRPSSVALLREVEFSRRDIVLVLPVRITRRKNIEFALHVIAQIRRMGKNPLLLVTGPTAPHHPRRSEDYLAELRSLAGTLGIGDNVSFISAERGRALTMTEVGDLYALSDALFLPSQSEGFGLPIIEAGGYRIPIICSDLTVFKELAGDAAQYFDPLGSPKEVAERVLEVTNRPASKLYSDVVRKYDWSIIYARMMEPLLNSLGGAA